MKTFDLHRVGEFEYELSYKGLVIHRKRITSETEAKDYYTKFITSFENGTGLLQLHFQMPHAE